MLAFQDFAKANEELLLTDYGDHFWSQYHEQCIQAADVQQLWQERDQAHPLSSMTKEHVGDETRRVGSEEEDEEKTG